GRHLRARNGAGQVRSARACELAALGGRLAGDLRRGLGLAVTWAALPAMAAAAYYLLALAAIFKWRAASRPRPGATALQPLSILKPVHGRDPKFYEAIRSHALQDYPEFEILFGLSDPNDLAAADIARLQAEFPRVPISAFVVRTKAPNAKV